MAKDPDVVAVAGALQMSVSLLRARLRAKPLEGDLTFPEMSALARLDRGGPATAADLARLEQISPQSMGSTLTGLEARGLIDRENDPADGRRIVLSLSKAGRHAVRVRRTARAEQLAEALATDFTRAELRQLMAAAPLIE